MLLTRKYMEMREADGPEKFKAKEGLDDDQKAELREFDEEYFERVGEHIITNYQDLSKPPANEGTTMQTDYSKLSEQEALEVLRREWPEYNHATDQKLQDGISMVEWLNTLESFG